MSHSTRSIENAMNILRANGFRATTIRAHLLILLEEAGAPLSIQKIALMWKDKAPNITTLYRSLSELSSAGIVRRIDLNTGIAHFEYTPSRPHHHHIVCNRCGKVEELKQCSLDEVEKKLIYASKHFKSVCSHTLEFFGCCIACTN